ncbi:MAG: cytidylate kinase-like family protein [Thermodesulfovibrionales bacterium]
MAILTVSREFGSGGREIGQAVAKVLNYTYIDKERLLADMRASGKEWEEWGKNLDEHCPTIWEKYDWSFRGFTALLQSLILHYALTDRVVIMGRGGNFLLKDIPYALRIRVVAPLDKRIDRIIKRESMDRDTAHWLIEKTDRDRSCLIHLLYGKHWDDQADYDMVFDAGEKTLDEIVNIVKDALLEKEKFTTDAARKLLQLRATAAKIKAEILVDHGLFIPTLDVYPEGEDLILRGVIHSPKEHKTLEDKAKKIAGDIPLKCQLHYRK